MELSRSNIPQDADFDEKLDSLRSTLKTMLHEATTEAQPVQIDPVNGIDFYEKVQRFEIQLIESALFFVRRATEPCGEIASASDQYTVY